MTDKPSDEAPTKKANQLMGQSNDRFHRAHDMLEQRVDERTADLSKANLQLQKELDEHRRMEATLRQSEEKYRLLVENANDAIFVIQDGMIKFANPSASAMTGYSTEELTNLLFTDMIHPADRQEVIDQHFSRLSGEDVIANNTFRVFSKTGKELWQQINSVTITWEQRPAILSFIRDITQEKRLERQLVQSQKMRALGTLAGGIANDFNNLMTTIQGNVSLMLFDVPASHPNYQNLVNIEKQIQRGTRLTAQLLGFAKKGHYRIQSLNLNDLVTETAEAFGRTKKAISIQRHLAQNLASIEADRGQIEQALLNLYLNAADAMPGGGRLMIKTNNVNHEAIKGQIHGSRSNQYVQLTVSDSGAGMEKETQERIFDPFFTTKETSAGNGLGLATVYGIINSHNGYIDVESAENGGTTFFIFLPVAETRAAPPGPASDRIIEGHGTILLVDDEVTLLEVGVQLLEKLGYQVLLADNGRQAVELYKRNRDQIDLVILDIIMPEMGGDVVFDKIRQIKPDAKVLLSSGYSINARANEILNRGGSGYIQKPFTLQQLSQKIKEVLSARESKAKN